MSKSTVHQVEDGTFRVEEVPEIPERLRHRGGAGIPGKWLWLKELVVALLGKDNALKIECPNRIVMKKAQAAAQNCGHGKAKYGPLLPKGRKVVTRSEPAPGQQNGVYYLYVEVVKVGERA